ncbi:hypothetical protein [Streptosporangium saharense]|uniref:hypothetical protein n=1 Tax=Streptosporangium saharense TaxID=1706840 RepID=UPI00342721F9
MQCNLAANRPEHLAPWEIEAKSPDDFVLDQIDLDGRVVWACVQQIADSRVSPPETVDDVLDALEKAGRVGRRPPGWLDRDSFGEAEVRRTRSGLLGVRSGGNRTVRRRWGLTTLSCRGNR